jgi:hypothetical protein
MDLTKKDLSALRKLFRELYGDIADSISDAELKEIGMALLEATLVVLEGAKK